MATWTPFARSLYSIFSSGMLVDFGACHDFWFVRSPHFMMEFWYWTNTPSNGWPTGSSTKQSALITTGYEPPSLVGGEARKNRHWKSWNITYIRYFVFCPFVNRADDRNSQLITPHFRALWHNPPRRRRHFMKAVVTWHGLYDILVRIKANIDLTVCPIIF